MPERFVVVTDDPDYPGDLVIRDTHSIGPALAIISPRISRFAPEIATRLNISALAFGAAAREYAEFAREVLES